MALEVPDCLGLLTMETNCRVCLFDKKKTKDDKDATKVILKFALDGINVMFFTVPQGGKYHYFICEI